MAVVQHQTILFVETKWKTLFWNAVGRQIVADNADVDIQWLVTNPLYAKGLSGIGFHELYPEKAEKASAHGVIDTDEMEMIAASDRMATYYGAGKRDYQAMADRIQAILEKVRPDLVIGEAVLPAELLCACLARKMNIPYLSPLSARYPSGRFYLYQYETYIPFSVRKLEADDALGNASRDVIDAIRCGSDVPDYMRDVLLPSFRKSRTRTFLRYLKKQWLNGRSLLARDPETPPFFSRAFRMLEILACKVLWKVFVWRRYSPDLLASNVLYPMQVQPEANLDVVGWPYRRQDQLIGRIINAMPSGSVLLVKANPKSKCELNIRLLRILWKQKRCIPLPFDMSMREILNRVGLVVTVTGTVALECMARGQPVVSLAATSNNIFYPVFHPDPFSLISDMSRWSEQALTNEAAVEYFDWVIRHSFPGEISDPMNHPHVMSEKNLRTVADAILAALQCVRGKSDMSC